MSESSRSRLRRRRRHSTRRHGSRSALGAILFLLAGLGAAVILVSGRPAAIVPRTNFDAIRIARVPEMPALAVDLVAGASTLDRPDAIRDVLKAISVSARPGVLPYAVSALLRQYPEDYEVILQSAAEVFPASDVMYAAAAAKACPDRAEQITYLLARSAPEICVPIAVVVWQQVHGSEQEIIRGLTNAVPRIAPSVAAATSAFGVQDFQFVLENALDRVVIPITGQTNP
jgi:hypothetical protein